jgi:hypothetical protein
VTHDPRYAGVDDAGVDDDEIRECGGDAMTDALRYCRGCGHIEMASTFYYCHDLEHGVDPFPEDLWGDFEDACPCFECRKRTGRVPTRWQQLDTLTTGEAES